MAPTVIVSTGTSSKQTAIDEAKRILATFVGPPGSTVVGAEPAGTPANLDHPSQAESDPHQIDLTGWLVVPGAPQAVLDWLKSNAPAGSAWSGGGGQVMRNGAPSGPFSATAVYLYSRPAISAKVLGQRQVVVQPSDLPGGRTVVRLDAQVDWLAPRPTGDAVPAGAASLTVVTTNTMNPTMVSKSQTTPTTTTDPSQIGQITAWVNALPTAPTGTMNCGADLGTDVRLTFRAAPGGPPIAVVDANPGGCLGVTVTLGGVKQAPLWSPDGFVGKVYGLLGIQACQRGGACS